MRSRKRGMGAPPTGRWWPSSCNICHERIPQDADCLFCDIIGCQWAICDGHAITATSPLRCPDHAGGIASRSVRFRRRVPQGVPPPAPDDATVQGGTCGGAGGSSSTAARACLPPAMSGPVAGGAAGRSVRTRARAVSPEAPDPRSDVPSIRAYFFHPHVIRRARFLPEMARNVCIDSGHTHMAASGALAKARMRSDRYLNCPQHRCLFCCRWQRVDNPSLPGVCPQHGPVPPWWIQRNPRPPPRPPDPP